MFTGRSGPANDTCIVGSFMLADMHIGGCHVVVIALSFVRKESNDLFIIHHSILKVVFIYFIKLFELHKI